MNQKPAASPGSKAKTPSRFRLSRVLPYLITLALVVAALWLVGEVWKLYVKTPWTRDAFVRVRVTQVATEGVSGYVTELPIIENQWVEEGQLLFRIDPTRYALDLAQAQAALEAARAKAQLEREFAASRMAAGDAISSEEKMLYLTQAKTAELEVARLQAMVDLARFNLDRTSVYAPVSGYVNNLNLRVGSYLADGQNAVVLLDGHSFWVEAYFQETKLPLVKPGDKAAIKLMAYESPIQGTVISISKAIANPNNDPGFLGLQQTDPVDAWVRLAQRIPVYVRIDEVPEGVMIAAGMTASVAVGEAAKDVEQPDNLKQRILRWLALHL